MQEPNRNSKYAAATMYLSGWRMGARESYVIYIPSAKDGIEFQVNSLPKFHRISFGVFAEYLVKSS